MCMREDMWKGKNAPPQILPHAHMHSQLEMTQKSCVHEGGCVERQMCPSTHSPSCTHAQLQKNHSYLAQLEDLQGHFMVTGNWYLTIVWYHVPGV